MSQPFHETNSHWPDLPPLRPWQSACIRHALDTLSTDQPHFLCQATPGAGKMLMAAMLTRELMEREAISYVLYLGPTTTVVERAAETLAKVTGREMHGRLGAHGAAFTYHALRSRLNELKRLASQAKVLLIWDESHHAAGHPEALADANQWGMALMALERQVRFTLALSGTPWRTDGSCLPLLRYLEAPTDNESADATKTSGQPQQLLQPDFIYTLEQAIQDGVCRYPRLQLVDNRSIRLTSYHPRSGRRENRRFTSIPNLLKHPAIHYSSLLRHDEPMQRLLDLGSEKLDALRKVTPDAAGLVIASDIAHAEEIAQVLEDRHQTVCLVTSKEHNAHARLQAFRDDTSQWIVSVGMVSEGVDIPRLRVCCYLSHIRTEQHFRQVLGRIIRRQGDNDGDCFLYALNEPLLRRYARRVTDDLPEDLATAALTKPPSGPNGTGARPDGTAPADTTSESGTGSSAETMKTVGDSHDSPPSPQVSMEGNGSTNSLDPDVAFSQAFFERLVALKLSL
ncbi:DEAD/DEAH box helicase [Halomonas sp.]|uniref:DEAD/DEAH box helicase n=1 Tax=Halomonas sp. TaxID=1486246 RepID=UPI00298D9E37|nr:DEAD/DEAH box helicase family protein [Halomonas sp.]MDW7749096.1 DEAD/DEAH box helicase family protein [Halomonas sp.]